VHTTSIQGGGSLKEGDSVEFDVTQKSGKTKAELSRIGARISRAESAEACDLSPVLVFHILRWDEHMENPRRSAPGQSPAG
jgi:hypothetical protein